MCQARAKHATCDPEAYARGHPAQSKDKNHADGDNDETCFFRTTNTGEGFGGIVGDIADRQFERVPGNTQRCN